MTVMYVAWKTVPEGIFLRLTPLEVKILNTAKTSKTSWEIFQALVREDSTLDYDTVFELIKNLVEKRLIHPYTCVEYSEERQ